MNLKQIENNPILKRKLELLDLAAALQKAKDIKQKPKPSKVR